MAEIAGAAVIRAVVAEGREAGGEIAQSAAAVAAAATTVVDGKIAEVAEKVEVAHVSAWSRSLPWRCTTRRGRRRGRLARSATS